MNIDYNIAKEIIDIIKHGDENKLYKWNNVICSNNMF